MRPTPWLLLLAAAAALLLAGCPEDTTAADPDAGGSPDTASGDGHVVPPAPDGLVLPDGFDQADLIVPPDAGDLDGAGLDGAGADGAGPDGTGADGAGLDGGGDGLGPDGSNTAPKIKTLPEIELEMGESTTLDLADYISDAEEFDQTLVVSWKAEHVAIADPGTHVLQIVAPTDWHGTEVIEVTVTDSGGLADSADLTVVVSEDIVEPPPDECEEITFTYAAAGGVTEVLVAGSFNGWAGSEAEGAYAMTDPDADGTWELTVTIDPGVYQYKLIVDGTWMADPGNPKTADDGYGGQNSVLDVCQVAPPPGKCGEVTFSYQGGEGVGSVLVSGGFNGWASSAADGAFAMTDDDGDQKWDVTVALDAGTYQYKLIVDGTWMIDPANPDTIDDGNGNVNSVVTVDPCPVPGQLVLVSHETDEGAGAFHAVLAAADGGAVDLAGVEVTIDWVPAAEGTVGAGAGDTIEVDVAGLAAGIHDVRVVSGGETLLLKVYIGVSTDWRDALLYFAMTDRFVNGDPSNDAPVPGVAFQTNYQGGDFAGIRQKIESGYFDDLGVSAIWISWPIDNLDGYEDGAYPADSGCDLSPASVTNWVPVKFTAYHAYWPAKLDETEEHFGTLEELQDLVVTAHARGIRMLLDFTANHVHDSSPFYAAHESDGTFNFPAEICQDVGWDNKPKTCWFTSYLPDLDYTNPAARKAIIDSAVWWIESSGADGFRFDAVKHLEMSFIQDLRARMKSDIELTGVDFWIVGETFTGDAGLIQSFVGPDKIHGQFDFPTNMQILKGFAKREIGLDAMDTEVRKAKAVYGGGQLMSNFLGNHDISRFLSMAAGSIKCGIWDETSNAAQGWADPPGQPSEEAPYRKLQLAFVYVDTIPGVPLIYYGDEFGLPGAGDPDNRRMMRFDADLSAHEQATLAFMKKLGQVRAAHPALRKGSWTSTLWADGDFLAYGRAHGADKALVLLNIGDGAKSADVGVGELGLADGTAMVDALGGGTATVSGGKLTVDVPGLTAAIYVLE